MNGPAPWRRFLVTLLAIALLTSCSSSSSTRDSLQKSVEDASAAVQSATLGLELLSKGRTTRQATKILLDDMVDELAKTSSGVASEQISKPDDQPLRDKAFAAVTAGTTATVAGRDCLSAETSCQRAAGLLQAASKQLDDADKALGGKQ